MILHNNELSKKSVYTQICSNGQCAEFLINCVKNIKDCNYNDLLCSHIFLVYAFNTAAMTSYYWYGIMAYKLNVNPAIYTLKNSGITNPSMYNEIGTLVFNSCSGITATLIGVIPR